MEGPVRYRLPFGENVIVFCFVVIVLCLQAKPSDCDVTQRINIDWIQSDYPFVTLVSRQKLPYEEDEDKTCTGCLVTHDKVITSAYCTYDQRRNLTSQVKVRHLVFCNNETQPTFVNRNATNIIYMDGYQNDLNRQMAIINLDPFDMTECRVRTVKIEINQYASRKVRLVSGGEPQLLVANVSIVNFELMKMYYGSFEYGIVFEDGGVLDKTDYASAILDLKSNNLLGFVFDKNPDSLTKSVYEAFYFYPKLEQFIKKNFGEDYYVRLNSNESLTDESITYDKRLKVNKPANFSYTLSEVEWEDHPYVVQVCNNQTKQMCSATLVSNNTVVTSPKCATQRVPNDTLVVTHYAKNRTKNDWELVTRHVTKWWIPKHRSCGKTTGPVHIDYIFMSLSPLPFQDEYDLEILGQTKSNLQDKRFHYVRLVSLLWSPTPAEPTCNVSLSGTKPKVVQLDTIATYNDEYHDNVYDCHIFNLTEKNVPIGNYPISRIYDTNYSGYHNGIHNFDSHDYSMLFDGGGTLLDYESKKNLIGIGFVEPCINRLSVNSYCRTEVTKSINVVKVVNYEPNLVCSPDKGLRINVNSNRLKSEAPPKFGDNQFVAIVKNEKLKLSVHCLGSLVTRNRLITSSTCLKDNLKTLNSTHLQVSHSSYVKTIMFETTRNVTNISFIGLHQQIAILHLAGFDGDKYHQIKTVKIEFNRFIPQKFVKFASFSRVGYDFRRDNNGNVIDSFIYTNSTEVQTATIGMIEYSRRLTGSGHEYVIPLKNIYLSPFDWGAPILDPITGNLLAVISRYEPYSLEPVFIASYFHPDMEARFNELLGKDTTFAHQNLLLKSHFIDESLSTKALDVPKPNDFDYILSEVPWINHPYIARICHEPTRKICTATLVGTNLAITSSHCLSHIPLKDFTFTQFAKNLKKNKWESITRNVENSGIVRHDNCSRARMPVGYTFLKLSSVESEFESNTTRSKYQPVDRQFHYARLLSVAPSLSLPNSSEWSCSSIDDSNLIQLDTLVSLNQEYDNQMYDCPIFNSTTINSIIANRSQLDSLIYLFDDEFHNSHAIDYSLLITDGSALFDYATDQLLGIGYNESCDDYEDFCMLSTIRPINFAKVVRLTPYTYTFQPNPSQDLLGWICITIMGILVFGIITYIVVHFKYHYERIVPRIQQIIPDNPDLDNPDNFEMVQLNPQGEPINQNPPRVQEEAEEQVQPNVPVQPDNQRPLNQSPKLISQFKERKWCLLCYFTKPAQIKE